MKTFNKVISLVMVLAFALSMMVVPAFAVGMNGYPTADGAEKLTVTYYSDAALTDAITTAAPGSTVYAKLSATLPTGTFGAFDVDFEVANATIESDTTLLSLSGFARKEIPSSKYNTIFSSKTGANVYITLAEGAGYDSPANVEEEWGDYVYTNTGVTNFDINAYKLTVGTTGTVSFTKVDGVGLNIGVVSDEDGSPLTTPFAIEGELTIAAASTEKEVSFDVNYNDEEYASTLTNAQIETKIKGNVTVNKVVDGSEVPVDVSTLDFTFDHANKKFTVNFAKGLATGEKFAAGAETSKTFTYKVAAPAPTPTYQLNAVYFADRKFAPTESSCNADYATYKKDEDLKAAFTVKMEKFLGSVSQGVVDAEASDYEVAVEKFTAANKATVTITFKGKLAETTAKTYEVTYTDVPEEYSDVKAELTTTTFANNTSADTVKAAVKVTAKKTKGVIVNDNVVMKLGTDYSVSIDPNADSLVVDNYTATVTLKGKLAGLPLTPADGKFAFTVVADTIEYDNYTVEFEGGNKEFLATATDTEIASKITVKADKKVNGSAEGNEEIAPTNYVVTIDRDTGAVTITFNADSIHKDAAPLTDTITFKDVIEHKNITTTMTTRMFAADASVDTIKAAVVVKGEVWKNGVKDADKTYVLDTDYTVDVDKDNKKVTVKFIGDLTGEDKEFDIAIGVTAKAEVKLGGATVNVGDKLTGTIKVVDTTEKVYAAEITLEVTKGTITNLAQATGYNTLSRTIAADGKTAKIKVVRNLDTAENDIATFIIDTIGLAKDDVIEVKVKDLKLTTVKDDNVEALPSFTGEATASATVTETAPATTTISAEFDIKTLGDVAAAADRFVNGLKVTKDGADVDATGKVSVVGKKLKLTDLEVGAGTYKVAVNVPGYTKVEAEIVVAADMTVTGGVAAGAAIYAGDMNADGNINAADYADLVAQYGKPASENVKCDLYVADADANINVNDIITMVYEFETYFGKTITTSGIIAE